MARQQFESQFKNKLDKREIKPSEGSWEQLMERFDSEEKKKKPVPLFWWAGIAASLIGGILIYSLVFNFNPNAEPSSVVDVPSEKAQEENFNENPADVQVVSAEKGKEKFSEEPESSSENNKINSATIIASREGPSNKMASAEKEHEQVVHEQIAKEDLLADSDAGEDTRIQSKLEETIAAVSREATDRDATDAEIDELLYKAAGEINSEKKQDYATGIVDANDLLFEVEMELEQSFRDKVFDLLKDGYTKAKTAVANRN